MQMVFRILVICLELLDSMTPCTPFYVFSLFLLLIFELKLHEMLI